MPRRTSEPARDTQASGSPLSGVSNSGFPPGAAEDGRCPVRALGRQDRDEHGRRLSAPRSLFQTGAQGLDQRPWNGDLGGYAYDVSENPLNSGADVGDHQVITRAGQVEAVVVPLEEYRALKALEQREAELYWAVHEARYPSRPGDGVPETKSYDSMEELLADLDLPEWSTSAPRLRHRPTAAASGALQAVRCGRTHQSASSMGRWRAPRRSPLAADLAYPPDRCQLLDDLELRVSGRAGAFSARRRKGRDRRRLAPHRKSLDLRLLIPAPEPASPGDGAEADSSSTPRTCPPPT